MEQFLKEYMGGACKLELDRVALIVKNNELKWRIDALKQLNKNQGHLTAEIEKLEAILKASQETAEEMKALLDEMFA